MTNTTIEIKFKNRKTCITRVNTLVKKEKKKDDRTGLGYNDALLSLNVHLSILISFIDFPAITICSIATGFS